MDIKDLTYFLAVAKEGTITKASHKLHISQPPLSRQLKDLENELGVTLFHRGKRHIELTDEGTYFKQQAEEILSLLDSTTTQLKSKTDGTKGTVSIGVTEGCGAGVLSQSILSFNKTYPDIDYSIWCGNSQEVGERLYKGLFDIGIVREPFNSSQFDTFPLRTEPWITLISKKNPIAQNGKDTIELSELADMPLIVPSRMPMMDEINSWFNEQHIKRHIMCRYNTLSSILPLVEHNMGIAISTQSVYAYTNPEKFVYKTICNPMRLANLLLIKRRHRIISAQATRLWNFFLQNPV